MKDDQLNELKQLIVDTVSTQVAGVRSDVRSLESRLAEQIDTVESKLARRMDSIEDKMDNMEIRLANRIDGLEVKLDDIQDAIGDAIMLATDTLDGQLQDHEHRLTVLERQAA